MCQAPRRLPSLADSSLAASPLMTQRMRLLAGNCNIHGVEMKALEMFINLLKGKFYASVSL